MNHSGSLPLRTSRETFRLQGRDHTVVPVVAELLSDWWTPVSAFHTLAAGQPHVFLLESVEGGERIGRYSFLGRDPFLIARSRNGRLELEGESLVDVTSLPASPLEALKQLLAFYGSPSHPDLPPFVSGAVGYFGYDTVRWIEQLPDHGPKPVPEDDLILLFLRDVIAFDHVKRRLYLITNSVTGAPGVDLDRSFDDAVKRLEILRRSLETPAAAPKAVPISHTPRVTSNQTPEAFRKRVEEAKSLIESGDIFQVVLSQRFERPTTADDLSLYRALRAVNPSPYMFLLRLDGWSAIGSSPEPLLQVHGDALHYRPIAGTVPRTGDPAVDAAAQERLLTDPKERAEHVMLVDLGRNDLGRVAVTGSVTVDKLMTVERYSHVMHLVSGLSARLRPDRTALDALYACFPAGTVSGAPKVRAMEIIEEFEPDRRGVYAGAVGYLDFSGNLDTCIALRTMVLREGVVRIQAGAGIVADSDPGREFEETRHKARALLEAVDRAEGPWRADP